MSLVVHLLKQRIFSMQVFYNSFFLIHPRRWKKRGVVSMSDSLGGLLKTRLHLNWKTLKYIQVCYLNPCMYNTYPNLCKGPDHLALPSSCCCRKSVTGAGKTPNISLPRRGPDQDIAIHLRQCDDSASVFRWLKCSNINDSMLFS